MPDTLSLIVTAEGGQDLRLPVGVSENIPKIKYHASPLQFMSEPGITQQDYDRTVLAGRNNPTPDELVTIKCPDAADGTGLVMEVKKATLVRSPTFARFCQSDDYLAGCHMQLTFITDPAVCFRIAIYYLEEGPDRFGTERLNIFLRTHFKVLDRFVLLIRLYALAMRMELPGLCDMAYTILGDYEKKMTSGYCITISSLIFARNASFDKRMKEWAMKHVRNYLLHLSQVKAWLQIVPELDPELQRQWAKLVEQNKRIIAAIQEEMLGTKKDEADDEMSVSSHNSRPFSKAQKRASALEEQHRQDLKVEEVIQQIIDQGSDSDQEWEDVEDMLQEPRRHAKRETARFSAESGRSEKAISVLGLPPSKRKIDAAVEEHNREIDKGERRARDRVGDKAWLDSFGPISSPEIAKARSILGQNSVGEKKADGKGKKRRRFSRRVHKLLH